MIIMATGQIRAYAHRLGPFFVASVALFGIGVVIGVVVFDRSPELSAIFQSSLAGFIKRFRGLPKLQLAAAIFFNNAIKTLAAILLGCFLALPPVIFLVINGAALGLVLTWSGRSRGVGLTMLSILPHGMFELPAVFLGTAIGLMIGVAVARRLFFRSGGNIKAEIADAWRFFYAIIMPMLFVAALIEAYVTPALVGP
jgi:stage II sporulation protein M